jgi:hypothetical protein
MKPPALTRHLVTLVLAVLVAVGIATVSFHEGRRYQDKEDTVIIANDGCFNCWMGLMALNSTNHDGRVSMAHGLDHEMDLWAGVLAWMALKYPSFVGPSQYQLLRRFRDYRKTYSRHYQYISGVEVNPTNVDQKVAEAIAYLGSIDDTNEWLSYKGKYSDLVREIEAQQKK